MKKGDQAHVTAHGITLEGEGLAEHDGRLVACPGLFPGESAEVRIEAVSRQHARAHARLLTLTTPHPQRRVAACARHVAHGGRCHGCALMELDEPAQRAVKRALLAERYQLRVDEVEAGERALGYRYSSKRVALGRAGQLLLGSYARGSHEPAAMSGCLVDHPLLSAAFDQLEALGNELALVPFDERSGSGDLRYVWAKTDGEHVIVTLVSAGRESRAAKLLAARFVEAPAGQRRDTEPGTIALAGLCHSVQPATGNQMRGEAAELLRGRAELSFDLLGSDVALGPLGFLQPNPQVARAAYAALIDLTDFAGSRTLAFDLYAGVGATTCALRRAFAEVVPCEAYPESARALGIEPEQVEAFLTRAAQAGRRPELIVANPPRKGLGASVCAALSASQADELRIMSCGPEGLARDLAALSASYRLHSLRAFDTLPQTPHVELVASLRRIDAAVAARLPARA